MIKILDIIKNSILLLIILYSAPFIVKAAQESLKSIVKTKTYIGKITIEGPLDDALQYSTQIQELYTQNIKALLLIIENSESKIGSSYALFNEIMSFKSQYPTIPIITLTENVCTSGGYYIACASDYIIASRTALIGSIGSYDYPLELKNFLEKNKSSYDFIKTEKYRASLDSTVFSNSAQGDKEQFLSILQNIYEQFVKDVLDRRPKIITDINAIAQGQTFTGNQALELGLIDYAGSFQTVLKLLKEKLSLTHEIQWIEPSKSLWQRSYDFYKQCLRILQEFHSSIAIAASAPAAKI